MREDGSRAAYDRPSGGTEEDRFLRIPQTFWKQGFDEYVDLPALAMLLVIAREKDWSAFPADWAPQWYGWSPDTVLRGLRKLLELDLVERRASYAKAPLTPSGVTMTYLYKLKPVMRPCEPRSQGSLGGALGIGQTSRPSAEMAGGE